MLSTFRGSGSPENPSHFFTKNTRLRRDDCNNRGEVMATEDSKGEGKGQVGEGEQGKKREGEKGRGRFLRGSGSVG